MGLFDGLFKKSELEVASPVAGRCVRIQTVPDPTFSEEILGKGVAVKPTEGKFYAPADGSISTVFPTLHAIGVTTGEGVEILIHVGLDTVQLKGQYFEAHVQAGDRVKKGDLLLDFDMDKIKEAGYDVITPVIVCNTPQFPKMECISGMEVKAGETAIIQL